MDRQKVVIIGPDDLQTRLVNLWFEIRGIKPKALPDAPTFLAELSKETPDQVLVWDPILGDTLADSCRHLPIEFYVLTLSREPFRLPPLPPW
ncbi:MAG: hypothetical protein GC165_11865 [Armatimonadetes bacterium]|nr:hypothetical protein [Armatimonadota bacterium]